MIAYYDSMDYSNVVSARYQIPLAKAEELLRSAQEDFLRKVGDSPMKPNGPFTYYLLPQGADMVSLTCMMPVEELVVTGEKGLWLDSYYSQEEVVCVRAALDELQDFAKILECMEEFCKDDGVELYGPVYYVTSAEDKEPYMLLKRGVQDLEE